MKSLLVHGCYDLETAETLKKLGVKEFALDLRGKSLSLISYDTLKEVLTSLRSKKIFLKFEDEKLEIILSYLDLLKEYPIDFNLIFEGQPIPEAGKYFWHYSKEIDYKPILEHKNILGVILPLKDRESYVDEKIFWDLIEKKHLEVYLHGDEEILDPLLGRKELKFSIELTQELEGIHRKIDQDSLQEKKIWRILSEDTSL